MRSFLKGSIKSAKKCLPQDLFVLANKRETFNPADPDLFVLASAVAEGETKIYIESIRDLKNAISLRPYYGPYQFVIIDDAHRLTPEASNGLLKLLEEPTGQVVFILVTSQPQELMPTISSRAQHITFLPHASTVVESTLDKSTLSKSDKELTVSLAQGRIGWVTSVVQSGTIGEIKKVIADFTQVLKSPLTERMIFAKTLFEKQPYQEHIHYWLAWAYAKRASLPNAHRVLTQLLTLHQYIQQPQYNHRALLENTLINL
jgi:hypothetical protein